MKKIMTILAVFMLAIQLTATTTSAKLAPIKVFVEGQQLKPDINPYVSNGRTLIEARSLFEAIGYTLFYDPKTRTVKGQSGQNVITLKLNSKVATVNGKSIPLDVAATTKKGRTVVPVRFVSDAVSMSIHWNQEKRQVIAEGVTFKDKDFERKIREELKLKQSNYPLLPIDLANITELDFYVDYPPDFPYSHFFNTLEDFAHLPNLKKVSIPGTYSDLRPLAKLTKLEHVNLQSYGAITSLQGLENKPNLKSLSVQSASSIRSLTPLADNIALEQLYLSESGEYEKDLSKLVKLSKLQTFFVRNIADDQVQYLNKFPNLTNLSISAAPKLTTVENLQLPKLQSLSINQSNLNTIHITANNTQLQTLRLSNNQLKSLHIDADLPKLTELDVTGNQLKELPDLKKTPNLSWLIAPNNQIESIKDVQNVKQLQFLYLSQNQIKDITAVSNLPKLEALYVSDNKLTTLPPLDNMKILNTLDVSRNELTSLEQLASLPWLTYVHVDDNKIQTLEPLAEVPYLREVTARGNLIATLPLFNSNNEVNIAVSATEQLDFEQLKLVAPHQSVVIYYKEEQKEAMEAIKRSLWDENIWSISFYLETRN